MNSEPFVGIDADGRERKHRGDVLEAHLTALFSTEDLVKGVASPVTKRLYRTVCRWWYEIEVLIFTDATTGKVEATNTAIKNIKRTSHGYRNPANYKSAIF